MPIGWLYITYHLLRGTRKLHWFGVFFFAEVNLFENFRNVWPQWCSFGCTSPHSSKKACYKVGPYQLWMGWKNSYRSYKWDITRHSYPFIFGHLSGIINYNPIFDWWRGPFVRYKRKRTVNLCLFKVFVYGFYQGTSPSKQPFGMKFLTVSNFQPTPNKQIEVLGIGIFSFCPTTKQADLSRKFRWGLGKKKHPAPCSTVQRTRALLAWSSTVPSQGDLLIATLRTFDNATNVFRITIATLKFNMESENGGLVQMIFLFSWVIFRFQPLNFRGVQDSKKPPGWHETFLVGILN